MYSKGHCWNAYIKQLPHDGQELMAHTHLEKTVYTAQAASESVSKLPMSFFNMPGREKENRYDMGSYMRKLRHICGNHSRKLDKKPRAEPEVGSTPSDYTRHQSCRCSLYKSLGRQGLGFRGVGTTVVGAQGHFWVHSS